MEIAQLPDISKVIPMGPADQPMVNDVIAVLKKHNALDRFGLTLLHQHFPVGADEVLVESTDVQSRAQLIETAKKGDVLGLPHTVTSWRLDTGQPLAICICRDYGTGHSHFNR